MESVKVGTDAVTVRIGTKNTDHFHGIRASNRTLSVVTRGVINTGAASISVIVQLQYLTEPAIAKHAEANFPPSLH